MAEYQVLTITAAFVFLYSLFASRLDRTPVNGALVYLSAGLFFGPLCLNLIDGKIDGAAISWFAERTLAIVLFADAANANVRVLRRFEVIPARLLTVGLPLTILLGFGVGVILFRDLGWIEIALLATMLAPTDAALGKAVVTNPSVPASIRESLNVESGLNDGICVPVLLLFLSAAGGHAAGWDAVSLTIRLPLQAMGIGAAVGLSLGFVGSTLLRTCSLRGWIGGSWLQVPVVALALLCFGSAQWLGGSGFIACFVGGLTFGILTREHKQPVLEAAEATGDVLAILTWFAFGTVLPPLMKPDWRMIVYAVSSLTVVRMLPVVIGLAGLGLRTDTRLFLGWCGPRGLASIVFAVMIAHQHVPGEETLLATAAWTVLFSVIAHGLSANFLAAAYGARVGSARI